MSKGHLTNQSPFHTANIKFPLNKLWFQFLGVYNGTYIVGRPTATTNRKGDSTTKWGPYSQPVQPCGLSFGFLEPM